MYLINTTLCSDELKSVKDGERKNNARIWEKLNDNSIKIGKELYNEISSVMKQKNNLKFSSKLLQQKVKLFSCLIKLQNLKKRVSSQRNMNSNSQILEKRRVKKTKKKVMIKINNFFNKFFLKLNLLSKCW